MSEPDNIIGLNGPVSQQLEIKRKHQERKYGCIGVHKNIEVDDQTRTITCTTCNLVIDPFEYLLAWSIEGDARMRELKTIEAKTKISRTELNDLDNKIKNARATLKRLGQPQPDAERYQYNLQRWNA